MIYAELTGGLGNQMFIYAFARALGLRGGEAVTLLDRQDWRDGAPAHTAVALESLCVSPAVEILSAPGFAKKKLPVQNTLKALMIKREQRGGMLARDWHGFEAGAAPALNRLGLHFVTDGFVPCRRGKHPANLLAWGYFQSERYFADAADTVRGELRTRPALLSDPGTTALAAQIEAAETPICLHLRRGDYQAPGNEIFRVCGPAYYRRAAALAGEKFPGGTVFVFSDDIDYARTALAGSTVLPLVFVPGGRPGAVDLALMQRCRHFILSNSTFSWWAQYLGGGGDKTVWAPPRWYTNDKTCDLYAPGWQLVRV